MNSVYKYFCLVLLFTGFVQINSSAEHSVTEDYSKMSSAELDKAFISAVKSHHSEKMQGLIQAGANVNAPVPYAWTMGRGEGAWDLNIESTALMYAVRHDCPKIITVLLTVKKKLNETLNEALKVAITEGSSDVAKELIKGGADINYIDKDKNTPLIKAISYGKQEIIKALLNAKADVTRANMCGRTALMEAVRQYDLNTVLELLKVPEINTGWFLGFGTKPINYADQDGNTALIDAVKHIRYSYVSGDKHGYMACQNSQSIVEALLKTPGIDPHHVNKKGETAITLLEKLNKKANRY